LSFPLRKAEGALAALITLVAVWLRYVAAASGGPLWRDEANTVGLATMPTLRDVWTNLQYDSFPMLWLLIVRALSSLAGPMNDQAFRAFGFFVGIGLVGVLWFYARSFRQAYPLLSLALFAMSPAVIVWGDSLRAYGFGIVLILLAAALLLAFWPAAQRLPALAALGFEGLYDELVEQLRHITVDIDGDGRATAMEIRAILQARHDGARRTPLIVTLDDISLAPTFTPGAGGSIGRSFIDQETGVFAAELLVDGQVHHRHGAVGGGGEVGTGERGRRRDPGRAPRLSRRADRPA